jgi:hypothetical protein
MSEGSEHEAGVGGNGGGAEIPVGCGLQGGADTKGGKSKEEIYLELAKLAQQSFESRRSYEWKLAFGLWTGIGFFTYFAVQHAGAFPWWALWLLLAAYLAIAVLGCVVWQPPLRTAADCDKKWKHYYMHRAEQSRPEQRRDPDPWVLPEQRTYKIGKEFCSAWKDPWTWAQVSVTIIFLFISWIFIASTKPVPMQDDKDRISVSGESAAKIVDKLTK